jgi:hypothetical protein
MVLRQIAGIMAVTPLMVEYIYFQIKAVNFRSNVFTHTLVFSARIN